MKEDFFKVGYSTYLYQSKGEDIKWTRRLRKRIHEHRFVIIFSITIIICLIMNFWLIYKFMRILEMNPIL